MNFSFRLPRRHSWPSLCALTVIAAILVYNTWMVACGHCTLATLLTIPWLGWLLITLNLLAAGILIALRRRGRRLRASGLCSTCSTTLRETWRYCPSCGDRR